MWNVKQAQRMKLLAAVLAAGLVLQPLAFAASDVLSGDVRITVTPADTLRNYPVPGTDMVVDMAFHGVAVEDALRALAKKGGFNIIIDESVTGTISVDLHGVSIYNALETIRTYGSLAYSPQGDTLVVTAAGSPKAESFARANSWVIPLEYANAAVIAHLLNEGVFGLEDSDPPIVTPDFHTNSLIAVGTASDIRTVKQHVEALDIPREVKTWRLNHANALDVAAILSSSLFNEGQGALSMQGGGGGGSQGGFDGQSRPSTLRVTAESIEEGEGAGETGGSITESEAEEITLRAKVKESQTIQVSSEGPIIIPDSRLNTITLMGTAEQIALAESLMPTLDRKLPQVVVEVSLIEISEAGRKELGFSHGAFQGRSSWGINNTQQAASSLRNNAFSNPIGLATSSDNPLEAIFQITREPTAFALDREYVFQLHSLINNRKAKLLANPTIITGHDKEASVSIVDEVISSVIVTANAAGNAAASEVSIGEVGIVLNVLPKVGADGSVNLRVRPTVTSVSSVQTDRFDNLITLLSRREVLAQNVTLKDGQSFVLGGLIQDTDSETVGRYPFLSKLPIVGALARNSLRTKDRTELVIVLTPHIMDDESAASRQVARGPMRPVDLTARGKKLEPGFVPVSHTENNAAPGVLPELQPVKVLGQYSHPENYTEEAGPASVLEQSPNMLMLEDEQPMPRLQKEKQKRLPPLDTSDEAIRAIMEKFAK